MIVNGIDFLADLYDILIELREQLHQNNIDLLKDIKVGPKNIQVTCIYHNEGHERRPSAGLKISDGTYHCFACGETHSLPEFISHCFGKNDAGAYGWSWLLKNYLTVEVENRHVSFNFSRYGRIDDKDRNGAVDNTVFVSEEELDSYRWTHPYWAKRGITDDSIIELFDLGYDKSTQSITFPVRDIEGNCLFVARRSVRTKYFNYPRGVQKPLYGLYELYNWSKYSDVVMNVGSVGEVIVCESMIDCILLWQEGHYALALNGLGNDLQMQQLRDLPCRRIIFATDNDDAGYNARLHIRKAVNNKLISEIQFPKDVKDIGECNKAEIKHILDWVI